jgi:hypothetical protein
MPEEIQPPIKPIKKLREIFEGFPFLVKKGIELLLLSAFTYALQILGGRLMENYLPLAIIVHTFSFTTIFFFIYLCFSESWFKKIWFGIIYTYLSAIICVLISICLDCPSVFSKSMGDKPILQKTDVSNPRPKINPLTNKELVQFYIDKGYLIFSKLNRQEDTDVDGHLHPSDAVIRDINTWKTDLRTKLPPRYRVIFSDDGLINGRYDAATNNTHPCDQGSNDECSVKNRMCVYLKLLEVMKAEE